jgi:hypothetical protein
MIALLRLVLAILATPFKWKSRLESAMIYLLCPTCPRSLKVDHDTLKIHVIMCRMGVIMWSRKWRALLSLSAACVLFTNAFAADPALTERDAQQMMEKQLSEASNCGVRIPIGEYNFTLLEAAEGGGKHDLVASLITLKKIGVVDRIELQSVRDMAHFRIELRKDLDKTQIIEVANTGTCIEKYVGPITVKVIGVTNVKGGLTRWDGSIIYTKLTAQLSELYKKYRIERKESAFGDLRVRSLARYDLFTESWKLIDHDEAPLSNMFFTTNNVPVALQRD